MISFIICIWSILSHPSVEISPDGDKMFIGIGTAYHYCTNSNSCDFYSTDDFNSIYLVPYILAKYRYPFYKNVNLTFEYRFYIDHAAIRLHDGGQCYPKEKDTSVLAYFEYWGRVSDRFYIVPTLGFQRYINNRFEPECRLQIVFKIRRD